MARRFLLLGLDSLPQSADTARIDAYLGTVRSRPTGSLFGRARTR
jgi:hypothetical protein